MVYDGRMTARRLTSSTDERGVVEVFDATLYKAEHADAAIATCGACGRSWDDAVITGWTPAPSARCVFEYDHADEQSADDLIQEWTEEARNLGREHADGPTSDDGPLDIIDLNALEALTGEGTSWGELADIQGALEAAYDAGKAETVQERN